MPWSTSQLAELAGTTVKTVRHYHQIGLLAEPERASNGYKLYGVDHLVRLLRVKRLSDLGVPLAKIDEVGEPDTNPERSLRLIDAEIEASIKRLQLVRAELASIIDHRAPADLPSGFTEVTSALSDSDRALLLIYSRVFSATAMEDLHEMVHESRRHPADAEFDALPDDADEAVRQDLAERYAPYVRELTSTYPWLDDPASELPRGEAFSGGVLTESIVSLYTPAQLDVMRRIHALLNTPPD